MKANDFLSILRNVALIYPGLDFSSGVVIYWDDPAQKNPIKSVALGQPFMRDNWPCPPVLSVPCSHWEDIRSFGQKTIKALGKAIQSANLDLKDDTFLVFDYGNTIGELKGVEARSDCLVLFVESDVEGKRR